MKAINHLAVNTFQRQAAVNALLELERESRDLLRRRTAQEIAALTAAEVVALGDEEADATLQTRGIREAGQRCRQISAEVAAALASTSNYQQLTAFNRARRQLDELRKFAVLGLHGRDSQVFARVAQQWLDAVNVEIDRLTEEERVTERIPNPYVAPRPLTLDSEVFFGRSDVFRFIEEHFLRADQNVPIVLHGQPRIGKSSLLRHLTSHLPTNLIPVYVDMQRTAQVESTGGLLYNLADAIGQELTRRGARLPLPVLGDYAAEPFIVFGKFLDAVETALRAPENRLILALDEFEEIEKKLTEGRVSQDLLPFLRSMMQHRQGIALLFAGTHSLDEMIQELWIPYFRSAVPCLVSYLDEADARRLITNPIKEFPLDYEPEAVALLLDVTRCHPCLIQLTCMGLVDRKNEQRSRHATLEDVRTATAHVVSESGDYVFHGIWDWIPPRERDVLAALAKSTPVPVETLARTLQKPVDEVRRVVERLSEAQVLEATAADGSRTYRFQVELFRQWVARHAA
jgi:AAA domain